MTTGPSLTRAGLELSSHISTCTMFCCALCSDMQGGTQRLVAMRKCKALLTCMCFASQRGRLQLQLQKPGALQCQPKAAVSRCSERCRGR